MAQASSSRSAEQSFASALPELPETERSTLVRYAGGFAALAVTLAVQLALEPIIRQQTPFLLFFAPVIFTAWWAGLRPAIAVTLIAVLLINYFFLGPSAAFVLGDPGLWLAMGLFVAEGVLFSVLVSALLGARRRAELARMDAVEGRERMAFLAEVSTTLASSAVLERSLPAVVARTVPLLADWCALTLSLDEDAVFRAAAGTPLDEQAGDWSGETGERSGQTGERSGQSAGALPATLVLPLAVRERRIGVMTLARREGGYGPAELALAEEVGRRIANAVETVQLFHASQRLNVELERRVQERTHDLELTLDDLRATNARLEVSNQELEQFAYVASHDLQEPLRKIQAFGDRLKVKAGPQLGDDARDYLDRMQNAAGRMQTLINDLLAFSRVTSKAQPFVPVDLNRVARDVLADLETRIEQSGGRVVLGPLPTIDADPLQMRQLFQNLIGNALKFHRPGVPPLVRVTAEQTTMEPPPTQPALGPRPYVRLSVADNGIGFDPKYLDRIFNVFQRLHGRGQYEGSGVGLAICRKIVDRHAGVITAASTPGEGATFVVLLPLQQERPRTRPPRLMETP